MFRLSLCSVLGVVATADQPSVTLNNGVKMPLLALGTNDNSGESADAVAANVKLALGLGFVSIDTARDYPLLHPGESQKGVGAAVRGMSRDSFFLITKVGGLDIVSLGPSHEYDGITKSLNASIQDLGVDHVDLMLLHFPPIVNFPGHRCKAMQEQWRALEDFHKAGKARAIGVSNYCQADIECILNTATVTPAVDQIMYHVGMGTDPRGLKSYLDAKGIVMQAYSPLDTFGGDHGLISGNLTNSIGKAYNKTGAQVSLRWVAEHGVPFNTASTKAEHLKEDLEVLSFKLTKDDLETLDAATAPAGEPNGGVPLLPRCGPVRTHLVV